MRVPFFQEQKLDKLSISNTRFYVDPLLQELRQVDDAQNRIAFSQLNITSDQKSIPLLFDKITRQPYQGYMPLNGLPPKTEMVYISRDILKIPHAQLPKPITTERSEIKDLPIKGKSEGHKGPKRFRYRGQ